MAQRIFLTGATDGIGLELARLWHRRGAELWLHGRRSPQDLNDPLFEQHAYLQADLARPEAATALCAELDARSTGPIDLLVHNAGTGYFGAVGAQDAHQLRDLVRVNLEAPIELTHALLPRVIDAGGSIVFVTSIAASLPCPDYAVYAATKASLEGFARSLRLELAGRASVQIVRPGPTRTGMHAKIGASSAKTERFPPAGSVAEGILRSIEAGRRAHTVGLGNRVAVGLGRNLAAPLDHLMRRRRS